MQYLIVQEFSFPSRGAHQVLKASERFEQGLDAPSLSEFFDGQMAQMQRSFIEMEREVEFTIHRTQYLMQSSLRGQTLVVARLHIYHAQISEVTLAALMYRWIGK